MFTKLAYAIEMSFEVPVSEKEIANSASKMFDAVIKELNGAKVHLDLMYDPFKKYENISTEAIVKRRGVISRFKQKAKENFNTIKTLSLKAIQLLNYFSTDTHTLEIINSFKDSVEDVEKQVVIFMNVLDDIKSPEFRNNVISTIEAIKKQCAQVEQLIKDRIIDHINSNILAKNWTTNDELSVKIQDRVPLITELFNERQKALEPNTVPDIAKRPQTLNPGNIQSVWRPQDLRSADELGEY